METVAAFDVDKTLTTRDCVVPFLWRLRGPGLLAGLAPRSPSLVAAAAARRRDRVKEVVTAAAVRGLPIDTVDRLGAEFEAGFVRRHLRPDTMARLRWHAAKGHHIVLVSASFRSYLEPLAAHVGAHAVLSTDVEVDERGLCTGRLRGANCRGMEKERRLREWLGGDRPTVYAYGDSSADAEMLAFADHAIRVTTSPISEVPA
ncbi:MAG: HAD-IB family hydrolase [Actinobacteria bacterium]|nr:HAD-IB family hydrolase [Actinomycetota bacterium]